LEEPGLAVAGCFVVVVLWLLLLLLLLVRF